MLTQPHSTRAYELQLLATRGIVGSDAETALDAFHLVGSGVGFARVESALRACGYTAGESDPARRTVLAIPRPHVPFGPTHVSEDKADADYLRHAVRNIEYLRQGERIWGSNLTATIIKLLWDVADVLDPDGSERDPTTRGRRP